MGFNSLIILSAFIIRQCILHIITFIEIINFLFIFEKFTFYEGDDTRLLEGGGARPRDKSERGVKPRYNEAKTDRPRPGKERGRGSRGSRSGEQGDSWDYVYKVRGGGRGFLILLSIIISLLF